MSEHQESFSSVVGSLTGALQQDLAELVAVCRRAADPRFDLVLAGEGNASLTTSDNRLFVTRSGCRMSELVVGDLLEVDRAVVLAGLSSATDDDSWLQVIQRAGIGSQKPTVEVGLHAVISAQAGAGVVLHTHPTDVLAVMAQGRGAELATARLFPDHVVMCGTTSLYVPYIDPGRALAAQLAASAGSLQGVILLGNHGVVVRGYNAVSALDVTLMVAKSARILGRTSGPATALGSSDIIRISEREDEKLRQRILGLRRSPDGCS